MLPAVFAGCRSTPENGPRAASSALRSAPTTPVLHLDGNKVTLQQYQGSVVLLDFWATWCPPCLEDLPNVKQLHTTYQDKGLTIVGISLDEGGTQVVRPFVKRHKIPYPILLDVEKKDNMRQAFQVKTIPALFLLDRQGQVVGQWVGKMDKEKVEAAIINALAQTATDTR